VRRLRICNILLPALLVTLLVAVAPAAVHADPPRPPVAHLELQPGEKASTTIQLVSDEELDALSRDPASRFRPVRLQLEAECSAKEFVAGDQIAPNTWNWCQGTVTATGPVGNKLWSWTSRQWYDYYGTVVVLGHNEGWYAIHWPGWSFVRSEYSSSGSGTWYAWAHSQGVFQHILYGLSRGHIWFDIYGNGTCYVDGWITSGW